MDQNTDRSRPRPRSSIPKQLRQAYAREKLTGAGAQVSKKRREIKPTPEVNRATATQEWLAGFFNQGWKPAQFQLEAWQSYAEGKSGLIISPTGSGKTLAVLGGPLIHLRATGTMSEELRIIYISPLKALVRDIENSVTNHLKKLCWDFSTETRTGDTPASERRRQREKLPHLLFTTPESLALLITQPGWKSRMMKGLTAIVIDEWHELLGSKRGSLLELTLARLRAVAHENGNPLQTWVVSATLANPWLAAQVGTGVSGPTLIQGESKRNVHIRTLLPKTSEFLPWYGHRGLGRLADVASEIDLQKTTLIFTNTRSQAEIWFARLVELHPEWKQKIGLHHGSLDREERERIEEGIKNRELAVVVATSSLDLGVDFPSVEKVIQIGSVKGVTRAIQRAGRAFHRPGEATELTVCPTHFLEYLEVAALREALSEAESRTPVVQPLDVLVQFVLNSALGEGFKEAQIWQEIRSAYSFRHVTEELFKWVILFLTTGGHTLRAYPQYKKLILGEDGYYVFATPRLARYHRMNMGTIVGSSSVRVRFLKGSTLGQIDEGFSTQLKPHDVFTFAGKKLELIFTKDLTVYVKLATGKETVPTVWGGTSLPLSQGLSSQMKEILDQVGSSWENGRADLDQFPVEIKSLQKPFQAQFNLSKIPRKNETLIERNKTSEGFHLFVYTWEGRLVNEGLGHLLAYKLSQKISATLAISANDYGFECLSSVDLPDEETIIQAFRNLDTLEQDVEHSLNFPELAKRAFREIAQISGLIQVGPPAERKSVRHLQMSSSLLFDVFQNYDPQHPLLREAFFQVKQTQLELARLTRVCRQLADNQIIFRYPTQLTPFAFPLYVARVGSRVSSETLATRIERLQKKYIRT